MRTNWPVKKLGEICEIARGGSPRPINNYLTNSSDGINWIKIGDVREGEKYINSTKEKISLDGVSKTRLVKKGDFILSNSMSFGRPYIVNVSGAIHDGWLQLRLKESNLLQDYLYYILLSPQVKNQFEKSANGGIVRNLNSDLVRKIIIPVPGSKQQKKIVERLDAIRKAQVFCDQQIKKTEELFDSLIFKELEVLEIETQTLDKVCDFQYGYTQSASDVGGYRFVRITDIDDYGEIRNNDAKFISDNLKLLKPYILSKEDLLVARTGATYGKVLLFNLDQPSVFASFLIRIIPDKTKILPKFIWLFSRSKTYWEQAKRLVSGTGQPQFNANKLKQIKIKLPSLGKQHEIVEKLEVVQNYKKLLLKQKSLLKELFDSVLDKSMKGDLFTDL